MSRRCAVAGGCICFYPSKVPLHYRAKYLGNRDMFGEMVKGARALNMSVIARIDPHAMSEKPSPPSRMGRLYRRRQAARHWAATDMYVTCQNGGFMFDFMPAVLKRSPTAISRKAFRQSLGRQRHVYCQACRNKFRTATGLELPTTNDPQNPQRKAYIQWTPTCAGNSSSLDDTVKASKKDCFFSPNGG